MKLAIVGDFWNEEEAKEQTPFIGVSGYTLTRILEDAGISRLDCHFTNVFNLKPPGGNDVEYLCGPKTSAIPGLSAVKPGKYIRSEYAGELTRLTKELTDLRPNLIVALGGTASWAVLGDGRVSRVRGALAASPYGKSLATYHPRGVLQDWSLRPIVVIDLKKAKREAEFPELNRPQRFVHIYPDLADLETWYGILASASIISFDIETAGDQITCIGFSPDTRTSYVIPFVDPRKQGASYWTSSAEERFAWSIVTKILATPSRKVTQNGLYDVHFLWRRYGITVTNWTEDTMLLHHALYIELQKGLDFLGSIYTDEASWKLMRSKGKGTIKKDE